MEKSEDIYWQRWQKLLEAAANFQELLTGSVMIGGSAAAVHLKHRYSFEIDLSQYKGIQPPFDSWDYIVNTCEEISGNFSPSPVISGESFATG